MKKIKDKHLMKKKIFYILVSLIFISVKLNADEAIYNLEAKKVSYKNNNNLIIAEGKARAWDTNGKQINSKKIVYDKEKKIITTEGNSIYTDTEGNKLTADSFVYNLNLKIIETKKKGSTSIYTDSKGNKLFADQFFYNLDLKILDAKKNVRYIDVEGNIYRFTEFKYFENLEKGIGQNLRAKLIDASSLSGPNAEINNRTGVTTVNFSNKNILERFLGLFKEDTTNYTPCILEDEKECPDWSIKTARTIHDKKNKMVYHDNAVVRLKNIPIFYTPYFSHPDPSVKRKSGFLPPSLKKSVALGRSLETPYFVVLDENKDLTFVPIFYKDDNPLFLMEYRQQNEKSSFYIDSSYTTGHEDLNKKDQNGRDMLRTGGSRSHFFFGFSGGYENIIFPENQLSINVQRVSQQDFLKVHQINNNYLTDSMDQLTNDIKVESYDGSKRVEVSASIYEGLDNNDRNTKYQYQIPFITYSDYFRKFNQAISIGHSFLAEVPGGDSKNFNQNNNISTSTDTLVFKFLNGLGNTFKTGVNNINVYTDNITNKKANESNDVYLTLAMENSFPLMKINKSTTQTIGPKTLIRYTSGEMKKSVQGKMLSIDDIFSTNRMNDSTNPETGLSLGYGIDYNVSKRNELNETYFDAKFAIGQVLRTTKLDQMADESSLDETSSDFAGTMKFKFRNDKRNSNLLKPKKIIKENVKNKFDNGLFQNKGLDLNYNYILSNDLNKILKSEIITTYSDKKNIVESSYYEMHDIGNEQSIGINYNRKIGSDYNFLIGGTRNIEADYTDSAFFEFNYDTDCLKIGLSFSKTFYINSAVPQEKITSMYIVLKPFGTPVSPNLQGLLKDRLY